MNVGLMMKEAELGKKKREVEKTQVAANDG